MGEKCWIFRDMSLTKFKSTDLRNRENVSLFLFSFMTAGILWKDTTLLSSTTLVVCVIAMIKVNDI